MDRMEELEANVEVMLGIVTGLQMVVTHIARQLPKQVAAAAADSLVRARPKADANLVASPVQQRTLDQTLRVLDDSIAILQAARPRAQAPWHDSERAENG